MSPAVTAGQHVLITGASGGMRMAAVTLARHVGAMVVNGMTEPAKSAAMCGEGGAQTLPRDATTPQRHFDDLIDITGGPDRVARITAMRSGGTCAVSGAIAGPMVQMDLRRLYPDDLTILRCSLQPAWVFAHLVVLINAGAIRPLIAIACSLADIAAAQADFLSNRFPGKHMLVLSESSP